MHVLIINGSPRVKEYSNTDKILEMFTKGLCENGTTFEQYEVSDVKQWKKSGKLIIITVKSLLPCLFMSSAYRDFSLNFWKHLSPK